MAFEITFREPKNDNYKLLVFFKSKKSLISKGYQNGRQEHFESCLRLILVAFKIFYYIKSLEIID